MRVHRTGGRIRVEVADHEACVPIPVIASPDDEHGRGLNIVAALANAWGINPSDDGKVVWFELAR